MDNRVWCVRAGPNGEADSLFREQSILALGWGIVGDLSSLANDRTAFRIHIGKCYENEKPGRVLSVAGMLFRFIHDIAVDDLVVYPSKIDRTIHIGRVAGSYR